MVSLALLCAVQFESFSQYRAKLANKTDAELHELKTNPRLWNVHIVLNVLHSLIDKSNINEQLEAFKNGDNPNDVAGTATSTSFLDHFSHLSQPYATPHVPWVLLDLMPILIGC